jgi:hypothetical protein
MNEVFGCLGIWGQIPFDSMNGGLTIPRSTKATQSLLRPLPKVLEKELKDSADRARRMAEAFGLKGPGVAPKPEKARGGAAVTCRVQKA